MELNNQGLTLITNYFSDFSSIQLNQLDMLEGLYKEWNEKINVISRKDMEGLYLKHILHSMAIAAIVDFSEGENLEILDIGTGGGFPGIPLAIMFPEVKFTLADSIGKKLKVIDAIVEATGINNITTRHTRVEEITDKKFDFIVSRAVAPLKDLWKWGKPLLKKGRSMETFKNGMFLLKGGDLAQEIFESNLRPHSWEISSIYEEDFFKEKFVLYCPSL
jgi:16S rRNA (guanine527-N7)-methyltransferase